METEELDIGDFNVLMAKQITEMECHIGELAKKVYDLEKENSELRNKIKSGNLF